MQSPAEASLIGYTLLRLRKMPTTPTAAVEIPPTAVIAAVEFLVNAKQISVGSPAAPMRAQTEAISRVLRCDRVRRCLLRRWRSGGRLLMRATTLARSALAL